MESDINDKCKLEVIFCNESDYKSILSDIVTFSILLGCKTNYSFSQKW